MHKRLAGFLLLISLSVSPAGIAGAKRQGEVVAGDRRQETPLARVVFESSDQHLVDGFNWARKQAMAYVFRGDPVGDWYEAALPGRSAFCMRDVSHQSTGAQFLGLAPVTRNLLRRFAENIAESRDWCTYWEINKENRPAPVDYKNDKDFWYCLPASFDVLNCCYRQYLWTGDKTYLEDPVFLNFYNRTVTDYVRRWDKDGDGLPESYREYGYRGLGSYNEDLKLHPLIGGDLVAAQYAGFLAYAHIQDLRKNPKAARDFRERAAQLKSRYNNQWWDTKRGRYYAAILQDRSFHEEQVESPFPIWFGITADGIKTSRTLDAMQEKRAKNVEEMSYLPEIAYRYGRNEFAYSALLELTDPNLKRREYPEVSYSVIGAVVAGTMGVSADASRRLVETLPRLTKTTGWAALRNLPVLENEITVHHVGATETRFTNQAGAPLEWKASFPVKAETLLLDGAPTKARSGERVNGQVESYVMVPVMSGATHTVRLRTTAAAEESAAGPALRRAAWHRSRQVAPAGS